MPEPILTVMIISCIIAGIGLLAAEANIVINVTQTLKLQKMNAKQERKYEKAKNAIVTRFTAQADQEDFFKIACLLHIARQKAKKHGSISVTTGRGLLKLTVSLQNVELSYKPYQSWYTCKCHFNSAEGVIFCTFVDVKSRERFVTYLNKDANLDDLESICRGEKKLADDVDANDSDEVEEEVEEEVIEELIEEKTIKTPKQKKKDDKGKEELVEDGSADGSARKVTRRRRSPTSSKTTKKSTLPNSKSKSQSKSVRQPVQYVNRDAVQDFESTFW